jgi:hypothetical protein
LRKIKIYINRKVPAVNRFLPKMVKNKYHN